MKYSDILKHVQTVYQAKAFSYEIDVLIASLFKKESFQEALNSVSVVTSEQIRNALLENKIPPTNHQKIKNFLVELRDKIQSVKPFKIYLAFQPSETTTDKIYSWVLTNLGFGYRLDIKEDKTIIGGAVVTFGGKYKDLSLRKSIEEAFINNKQQIIGLLSL